MNLSTLTHFAYPSIRMLIAITFEVKPSSIAPMVAYVGRMLESVTEFNFTLDNCICLKVSRALS